MHADAEHAGLGRRLAEGAAWMVGLRLSTRLVGLISITVLARLLTPDDFGVVALAMAVLGTLEVFAEVGTDAALIRHQEADRALYDAAWTINVLRGLVLAAALVALAIPAAGWFDEPRLRDVVLVAALVPLLAGFANVGIVDFRKQLRFGREFTFELWSRVLGTTTAIAFAVVTRSYWALLLGALALNGSRLVLSYAMHPYRPRPSLGAFWQIFHFSKWLYLQSATHGLTERLPALLIGRFKGGEQVALFNVGQEIAHLASTEIRAPIRRALFPGFAKLTDDLEALARLYVDSLAVIMLIVLPIPIGLGFLAPEVIRVLLGESWSGAVPAAQALAVYAAMTVLSTNSHLLFLALGRTHLVFAIGLVRLATLLPLTLALTPEHGAAGAAWAFAASFPIVLILDYALVVRVLPLSLRVVAARTWRLLVAAGSMCLALLCLGFPSAAADDLPRALLRLAEGAAAGALSYAGVLFVLWLLAARPEGPEAQCLQLCRRLVRR